MIHQCRHGVPFSVNHISESKISAHFPQWFSEQLDNTFLTLWPSNNNWSVVTDCRGTAALCLALPVLILFMFNAAAHSVDEGRNEVTEKLEKS